jgi:hypothetical protein
MPSFGVVFELNRESQKNNRKTTTNGKCDVRTKELTETVRPINSKFNLKKQTVHFSVKWVEDKHTSEMNE